MPRLSAWYVRFSLIYLLVGFSFGGLILAGKGLPFAAWTWNLLPAHIEFLLLGWMVQLALGVAFWILPRFSAGAPRGNEMVGWVAFVVLNAGIWLVVLQPLVHVSLGIAGRVAEALGVLIFVVSSWNRIRPFGR